MTACDERGFSLIEVIVAAVIAVIAVLGLAHSFGIGRGLINRFAEERNALAAVEARMEMLSRLPPSAPELSTVAHTGGTIELLPGVSVTESWNVVTVDDPADGLAGADPNPIDYRRVTARMAWMEGGFPDTIQVSRIFLNP